MPDPLSTQVATLKNRIASYTVDRLKGIIQGFNDHCGGQLSRSGKKSELQEKLRSQLDAWAAGPDPSVVSITTAKKLLDHIDTNGSYNGPTFVTSLHVASPLIKQPPLAPPPTLNAPTSQTNGAGPSGSSAAHTLVPSRPALSGINFKPSPFFEIESHVSTIQTCPESLHMQDRKTSYLEFSLRPEQREKLLSPTSMYQLRIYCTSSAFYTAPTAFRPQPSNSPCPVEFPNTCELRVNNVNLHAATKGLKKKPGTAPPANAGTAARTAIGASNKLEMIYCNNNPVQGQAPNNKKYYLQVNLVKVTTVEELVERLRKGKYRSKEWVMHQMSAANADDDDIVAGPQKVSLKCPLSYMRLSVPTRSSKCPHPSCFDATSWFQMMETTTTWLCPICEQTLDVEELIVDGYFDAILKSTHEETEDVMVEADGEWHTSDNKYHSGGWIPPQPKNSSSLTLNSDSASSSTATRHSTSVPPYHDRIKAENAGESYYARPPSQATPAEEIVLDSEDDDEDAARVHRQILPGGRPLAVPAPRRSLQDDVIDLTLDSDESDEEDAPFPLLMTSTAGLGKRKERSPTATSSVATAVNDSNKRSRSNGGWGRTEDGVFGGGYGDSNNSNHGVRSSYQLPSLQIGGGYNPGSSSAYFSPPSASSSSLYSPLAPPPFIPSYRGNIPIRLPSLISRHQDQDQPLPRSTSMSRLPLPPRPEWHLSPDRGYRGTRDADRS